MSDLSSYAEWLVGQWNTRFGEILLTMGDVQPAMTAELSAGPLPAELNWWKQPFDLGPGSVIWTGVPQGTQDAVGNIVLSAAGVEKAPPSEVQSTYLELLRQSLSALGQDIGNRLGGVVNCEAGAETAPGSSDAAGATTFLVKATLGEAQGEFYLLFAPALSQQMAAEEASSAPASAPPSVASANTASADLAAMAAAVPPSAAASDAGGAALARYPELGPAAGSQTFDLLLDVELPVSISFGRASLKLNDALKLITGSLIELDRTLADPVELLVNNCVIARGEVVVIEGNYGVRITEIVSQKERLQQSRRFMIA